MVFRTQHGNKAAAATAQEVRKLLHLDPEATEFTLAFGSVAENDRQIAILTRSMLEILAEASAGVEIPPHDVDQGRVTKMAVPPGTPESSPRFIVRVHSSNSKPDSGETFTAVRCRDHWFWVDDRDVPSKRGLGFLMILFTLVESETTATPPVLTISKP